MRGGLEVGEELLEDDTRGGGDVDGEPALLLLGRVGEGLAVAALHPLRQEDECSEPGTLGPHAEEPVGALRDAVQDRRDLAREAAEHGTLAVDAGEERVVDLHDLVVAEHLVVAERAADLAELRDRLVRDGLLDPDAFRHVVVELDEGVLGNRVGLGRKVGHGGSVSFSPHELVFHQDGGVILNGTKFP